MKNPSIFMIDGDQELTELLGEYLVSEGFEFNCCHNGKSSLQSAFNNVLPHAIKYSPEGSEITIKMQSSNKKVEIRIIDQGTGVPEHSLTSLFTPFYRTSTARERKTGGTGLGLAIAKQAVTVHDGNITAKNNDSGGLTMIIL